MVIGPPFERRFTLAVDKILRFDLSTKLLLEPVTVMFAPAVKSLDAPVAVSATVPEELIAPVGETTPPVIVVPPPLEVRVAGPEYVPEAEIVIEVPADTFLFRVTAPPLEMICTEPVSAVIVELDTELVVMSPVPEREIAPPALNPPVGSSVEPLLIVMFPKVAVNAPAPANVVLG
jgi:hypothetical protein